MRKLRLCTILALAAALSMPVLGDDNGGHGGDNHGGGNSGDDHGGGNNGGGNNGGTYYGNQNQTELQRTAVSLAATASGALVQAEGRVDLRAQGQNQRLKIKVEANVPDGTVLRISADGVEIATIATRFNEAEFEFETQNGRTLAGGILPANISRISVADASGRSLLEAQFAPVRAGAVSTTAASTAIDRRTLSLVASSAGLSLSAEGHVDLRTQGARQKLTVEMEARVPDGTVMRVWANGIALGSLIFQLQEAEFELETENTPLPNGIASIKDIRSLLVINSAGAVIMSATL